jgi:hypothetical protein
VLTEDRDECRGENDCEGKGDGGRCTNTDGGYVCGCAENFRLMASGPAAGQCVQDKWTYLHSEQSQTILAYPQDTLQFGWRVNEVRVFEKYDAKTRTCFGRCPDGSESPNCHYGVHIDDEGGMGAVAPPPPNLGTLCTAANCASADAESCAGCVLACRARDRCAQNPAMANCDLYAPCAVLGGARRLQGDGNLAQMGMVSNVRASDPYPGHYKDFLSDGDPKSAWWSRDLVVDRAAGTGAWVAFDVQRDPQCVRLEMPACAGHMPEVMVIHKGSGKITDVSPSFSSDASPFPRPGWTESRLHAVKPGVTSVDLGIDCGFTGAQYFGELLVEYTGVPSACQCKQLCLDHLDEGCETWKWFSETAHCYLQQDVFVGVATEVDTLKSKRAAVREEGLYLESGGWWRRSFSGNWPGWHTGDTGAVITEVVTDPPQVAPREPFSLTVKGLGFPSDAKALDRQRVKVVPEGTSCARGMPPDEVSGVRCTNWFTCAPKPVRSSRKSATWEGLSLAESKDFVAYKVCWCAGECWEGQNWLEAPRRLLTLEAAYVWGTPGFEKDAATRKDTPLNIKVTRRPFATTTHTDSWRLKAVRSVFGCDLLGDGMLCGGAGDCGHGTAEGPDEMSWDVAISDRVLAGDYKVCFSDDGGASWGQISSGRGLLLTMEQLAEDSQHPRGLFHEQRVSVRKVAGATVELKGYSMVEPFPGKLGVSPRSLGCSNPQIRAVLAPQFDVSGKESAVFTGDFETVTPGTYSLCYCNEDAYDVAEYHRFTGAPLGVSSLSTGLHEDLCAAKCSRGCVGPSCFCDGYEPQNDDAASSALCLSATGCRAACDSIAGCQGYAMERTKNRCLLYGSTTVEEADDFHTWVKSQFWPDLACNTTESFTAADAAELFAKSIGFVTVSERLHVGADFVVTPDTPASLELAGAGLTPKDQVIVIECSDQCGIAEPSPAVSMLTTRAVDAKFDAPSVMHGPAPVFNPELPQPNFMRDELQYCPGGNIEVHEESSFPLAREHQCYRKCEKTAPCTGPDCFCDGFFEGHDGPDSTALCLPLEQCKSLCALAWPFCYSIDVHREKNRCFLNGPVCSQTAPLTDPNYDAYINSAWSASAVEGALDGSGGDQVVTRLPANEDFGADGSRRLTAHLRALGAKQSAEEVRKLLAPPDYGLSWGDLLRFQNVTFHQAGTFKVCACDSAVTGGCTSPADFAVEVGKAHASGLQCLLDQPQFTRGECIGQKYGGLRCYEDGAPEVTMPWDELGVPVGLGPGAPVLFGAGPGTTVFGEGDVVEKVRAFCLYGTEDNRQYDFCSSFRL